MNNQNAQVVTFEKFRIRECIKAQKAQWKSTVVSELLTYAFTIWVSWQYVSAWALISWLVLACGATVFFVYALSKPIEKLEASRYWEHWAICANFVTAAPWGIFTLLFLDTNGYQHVVFLLCIYTAIMSGSLATNTSSQASYCAFVVGLTVPFFIKLISTGDQQFVLLGIMIAVYSVMMCFLSKNCNDLFIKSVVSSFENLDLVQKLSEEKAIAEKAVKAKTQFLAAASHDLRQPLNAINLFIGTLKTAKEKARQNQLIKKIDTSLIALNKMLHGLLDISKLDAEVTENAPRNLPLASLGHLLVAEYEKTTNVKIIADIDKDIYVWADQSILYRVVRNILDNAVKYTVEGEIRVAATTNDKQIIVTVSDTGIGIPSSELESVLVEFKQLNNPERDREKGLGLGLSIVDRLCKIAEFDLTISSQVGVGSTITIGLPKGVIVSSEDFVPKDASNLINKYLLVIDDEVSILDAMTGTLTDWGCNVIACTSQAQALSKLINGNILPDGIISDFRLRNNEDGITTISSIREEFNRDIPAILITGDTAPDRITQAHSANVSVMFKPIQVQQLKDQFLDILV